MTSGFKFGGSDLDDVFEPYVSGAKAPATGYKVGSQDLCDRFAPIAGGDPGPETGFKVDGGGLDLNAYFAVKGSVSYALGFDGQSYSSASARATASLSLSMKPDGTWTIVNQLGGIRASGHWLKFGGSVSDYTVKFEAAGFSGGAGAFYSNGAPTQSTLTAERAFSVSASAGSGGDPVSTTGSLAVYLYKAGALIGVSQCNFTCTSTGF